MEDSKLGSLHVHASLHGFHENTHKLGKSVARLVQDPGECVHVELDFVALHQVHKTRLAGHGILVIVDMVLVVERCDLSSVPPQSNERLFHVMSANIYGEEISAWKQKNV